MRITILPANRRQGREREEGGGGEQRRGTVIRDIRAACANKTIAPGQRLNAVAAQTAKMQLQEERKERRIEEERRKVMRIALKLFYGRRR